MLTMASFPKTINTQFHMALYIVGFFLMRLFALFSFGFVFWLLVIIFQIYIQFKTYIKLVISSSVQRWLYDKRKVWWSPIRKR